MSLFLVQLVAGVPIVGAERERERAQERDRARGKGILGLIFAGYVLLASQNAADSTFY